MVMEGKLVRIGTGVYAKAAPGPISGIPMARQPLGALAAETFDRLGIPWQLGAAQRRYNERLTTQVAEALERELEPQGVIVVIECEHLCMSMRGIRKPGARTVTSAVRGQLRDPTTRAEAMLLISGA